MAQYLAPGVYVEEVPSAIKPIAGVGTSTAGFIGIVPDTITVLGESVYYESPGSGDGNKTQFSLTKPSVDTKGRYEFRVAGETSKATLKNPEAPSASAMVVFDTPPPSQKLITGSYIATKSFTTAPANIPLLCTSFSEFTSSFGDFALEEGQRLLAHAVYGFFNNGGTRCYVARIADAADITKALTAFEPIDEIAIMAVPGVLNVSVQTAVVNHCENMSDRFAILDGQPTDTFSTAAIKALAPPAPATPSPSTDTSTSASDTSKTSTKKADAATPPAVVPDSNYAAMYFPWISVYDPIVGDSANVPPSGHMAGVYARVDTQRGVHKAPANEVIRGATGVQARLSKAHQDGLNPDGINVIRSFDGNITVWGARTLGGDKNNEWKYINARRLFLFLRKSIDQGTQWVVFEPNAPQLWAKIRRNVSAFLTMVWSSGALFGNTPAEAFYVRCDEITNPSAVREQGQVVTEIGVALVRPAEFVIFRLSQWAGPEG